MGTGIERCFMPRERNIELVKHAAARFSARDLEGYLELYIPAVVHHGFRNSRPGIAGLRDHFTHLRQGFPDMRIDTEDIIADGEKVVHRYLFSGTHLGEYLGLAPTGIAVRAPGMIFHLFQGKCVEVWQVVDSFGFMAQIGAARVPQLAKS